MYSSLAAQAKWNSNHLMLNDDDDDDDPDCFSSGLLSFHETFKSFFWNYSQAMNCGVARTLIEKVADQKFDIRGD